MVISRQEVDFSLLSIRVFGCQGCCCGHPLKYQVLIGQWTHACSFVKANTTSIGRAKLRPQLMN